MLDRQTQASGEFSNRLGRYVLIEELGRGGMGVVYSAFDPKISREIAIKTISLDQFPNKEDAAVMREFLLSEAKSAGHLQHPGIATIYDVGEDQGNAFIVMERIYGGDLSKTLNGGKPTVEGTLRILSQTADAVDYANERGVIHRDIKPANILIDRDGAVKLTDFGIAKMRTADESGYTVHVVGTPRYMSPEQTAPGNVTSRSDQYSLAVLAYELLTGSLPFKPTPSRSVLVAICCDPRPSAYAVNPSLPPRIDAVLSRGMAIAPEDRYPSCKQFVQALEQCFVPVAPPVEVPVPTVVPLIATTQVQTRRPFPMAVAAMGSLSLALCTLAGVLLYLHFASSARTPVAPAPIPFSVPPPVTPQQDPDASIAQAPVGKPVVKPQIAVKPHSEVLTRDPAALLAEGKSAYLGQGGVTDAPKAASSFEMAAEGGNAEAMMLLGTMYVQGTGVTRDYQRAVFWLQKSAAAGNRRGMDNLAHMYADGYGVQKNPQTAAHWYQQASDLGDADAAYHLGLAYEHGAGVPADLKHALTLYRQAAAGGKKEAEFRLKLHESQTQATPSAQDAGLLLRGIDQPIARGQARQYRLTGSGLSLQSLFYVEGATSVGSRFNSPGNHRAVEVAPDGSWAKIFIAFSSTAPMQSTQITVQSGSKQAVLRVSVAQ